MFKKIVFVFPFVFPFLIVFFPVLLLCGVFIIIDSYGTKSSSLIVQNLSNKPTCWIVPTEDIYFYHGVIKVSGYDFVGNSLVVETADPVKTAKSYNINPNICHVIK